jgi:2-(3-amino-3-carboxypropyl)histidine synthase
MKLLLQLPQGLKQYAIKEADALRKEGHEVYISATPCWGACDLAIDEAKKIGAQKLIHYGHAKFHEVNEKGLEVEYRLYPITADLAPLRNALPMLSPYKKLAIVTTVSHIHQLDDMKKILREGDKEHPHEIFTSRGVLAIMEGQVLGCDSSAADRLAEIGRAHV